MERERLGFFKEHICPDPKLGGNCSGELSSLVGSNPSGSLLIISFKVYPK